MNFPKRLELLLYTVLAFPKASMMGLQSEAIKQAKEDDFFFLLHPAPVHHSEL